MYVQVKDMYICIKKGKSTRFLALKIWALAVLKFFDVVLKFELPNARVLNFPQNSAPSLIGPVLIIGDCVYYLLSLTLQLPQVLCKATKLSLGIVHQNLNYQLWANPFWNTKPTPPPCLLLGGVLSEWNLHFLRFLFNSLSLAQKGTLIEIQSGHY